MRTGGVPLGAWGAAILLVVLLGVAVFDLPALPAGLLAGAGAGAVLAAIASALDGRRHARVRAEYSDEIEVLPRSSLATVAVAFGLTLALVGAVIGQALLWPGVGVALLGAGGLVRERRATRRLLDKSAGR